MKSLMCLNFEVFWIVEINQSGLPDLSLDGSSEGRFDAETIEPVLLEDRDGRSKKPDSKSPASESS